LKEKRLSIPQKNLIFKAVTVHHYREIAVPNQKKEDVYMKKVITAVLLTVLSIAWAVSPSFAQDTAAVEAPTDSQFSYGTVLSATASSIKINEYDFETDTSEDVVYDVSAQTKLENVNSISDIMEGDEVEVEYVVVGNRRSIVSIYVE